MEGMQGMSADARSPEYAADQASLTVGGDGPVRLRDCGTKPNCVCTQASQTAKRFQPLGFKGTPAEAMRIIGDVMKAWPRTTLLEHSGGYAHYVCRTAIMRFADDVEFLAIDNQLQMRSASRLGYSDLGANRKRVDAIASKLVATGFFVAL